MGAFSNIVILLSLIATAIILYYFIRDYTKYKTELNTKLSKSQSIIDSEKADRVGNLKYVVDQVNTINQEVASVAQDKITKQNKLAQQLDASQGNIIAGLNSAISFTDANNTTIPLVNLPGADHPNMHLLKHVTATMGLTTNDLNVDGTLKMCSSKDPNKCISLADKDGNTYLTDIGASPGSVILDARNGTNINNSVNLNGNIFLNSTNGTPSGIINTESGPNTIVLQTGMVGVGDFTSMAPNATLHVNSTNTDENLFELTTKDGQQLLNVAPNGSLAIYLNGDKVGIIQPVIDEHGTGIKIIATNVVIDGNLVVDGNIQANLINTATYGPSTNGDQSLMLQCAAPPPPSTRTYIQQPPDTLFNTPIRSPSSSVENPPSSYYSPAPSPGQQPNYYYSPAPSPGQQPNNYYSPAPSLGQQTNNSYPPTLSSSQQPNNSYPPTLSSSQQPNNSYPPVPLLPPRPITQPVSSYTSMPRTKDDEIRKQSTQQNTGLSNGMATIGELNNNVAQIINAFGEKGRAERYNDKLPQRECRQSTRKLSGYVDPDKTITEMSQLITQNRPIY